MLNSPVVVVGAGLFGLTVAERLASQGQTVHVFEARDHIGGNAWSTIDPATGIEVHTYGAHIFHTSNRRVWEYVNRFTSFTGYRHRVWALHDGQMIPLPFSLATLSALEGGRYISPAEAEELLGRVPTSSPENLEDKARSLIGDRIYQALVRGYTAKQWQTDPRLLPAEVITRLPFRLNYDTDYFSDVYQGLPTDGYAAWVTRLATHPRVHIETGRAWHSGLYDPSVVTIYTGPLDRLHDYSLGVLGWRTIDLSLHRYSEPDHLGVPVLNFSDLAVKPTRAIEFKHFHPERKDLGKGTVVAYEYSRRAGTDDEPYYPVNSPQDRRLVARYRALTSERFPGLVLGGRLATYTYLDMHMAIASALVLADRLCAKV